MVMNVLKEQVILRCLILCSKEIAGFLVRYVDPKDLKNPPKG